MKQTKKRDKVPFALALAIALVPLITMLAISPVEAAVIPHPRTTINISPSANQASFKEFSVQGIPVTPALASVMPTSVVTRIAHGQRLVGVAIRHFFFARRGQKMVPTSLATWEQLNHLLPG